MAAAAPPSGPSDFAVGEFMSKIDGKGSFAKKNRFKVEVTPPPSLQTQIAPADIEFLIKSVSFPGRTFGTTNLRYGGKYGMEVPYETTPGEAIEISFQESNSFEARRFWHDWLQHIQSTDAYNMRYYDSFKGTIKISIYAESDRQAVTPKHKVTLIDAWPKGMASIALGWENAELLDFGVDIVYKKWEIEI